MAVPRIVAVMAVGEIQNHFWLASCQPPELWCKCRQRLNVMCFGGNLIFVSMAAI